MPERIAVAVVVVVVVVVGTGSSWFEDKALRLRHCCNCRRTF